MALDHYLFHMLFNIAHQNSVIDGIFIIVSRYYPHLLIFLGLILLVRGGMEMRIAVVLALSASLLAFIINLPLRHLIFRPRPFLAFDITPLIMYAYDVSSFPSNHAAASYAFGSLFYSKKPGAGIIFIIAALVVGISRVVVGVHYPGDIIAGILSGYLAAIIVNLLSNRVFQRALL